MTTEQPGLTADEFIEQVKERHPKADAWIVCETGVSGDDPIKTMTDTGYWRLSDEIDYIGGKRIRTLVPNEQAIIAAAKTRHDAVCDCDPKYLMSCSKMAAAILEVGREGRSA